jgi:hypothetical protein
LVLDRSEQNPRLLWWTVPLTFLWVNLHAEYALGIALLGLFLIGEAVDAGLGFREWTKVVPRLRSLAIALLACLAVVPLNPNGIRMYSYPFETLKSPAMQQYIAEWASPNFHEPKYFPFGLMLLAIVFLLSLSGKRVRPRDLLLLVVVTAGALRSVRHISVFVLVAVPILSGLAQGWWHERIRRPQTVSAPVRQRLAVNALVLVSFFAFSVVRIHTVVSNQPRIEAENFPSGAASFLASHRPSGPMFNHYNFGGYFIWKLYPDYPVYIDGRADVYGDQFLHDFAKVYYVTDPDWLRIIRQWHIQTVILPPDAPLIAALRLTHGWKEAYSDSRAVVLTYAPQP